MYNTCLMFTRLWNSQRILLIWFQIDKCRTIQEVKNVSPDGITETYPPYVSQRTIRMRHKPPNEELNASTENDTNNKETIPPLAIIIQPQPEINGSIEDEKDDARMTPPSASVEELSCTTCNKKFSRKFTLQRHVQTVHQNLKLFYCKLCNRYFSQKNNLEKHLISHAQDNPFNCSLCSQTFASKEKLKRHFASVHLKRKSNS